MTTLHEKPLHILVVGNGGSVHVLRRAEAFASLGHTVTLLTPCPPAWMPKGVVVRWPERPRRSALWNALGALQWARRLVKELPYDVMYVHYVGGPKAWWSVLTGRRPFVCAAVGTDVLDHPKTPKPAWQWRATRILVREASAITAESNMMRDHLIAMGAETHRVRPILWGVDCEHFKPRDRLEARRELDLPADKLLILSPRNLRPEYNIDVIVESMREVADRFGDSQLLLTEHHGDADYRRRIAARIHKLGLCEHVRWLSEVPARRMSLLYSASDVAVSLSPSDGMPQTMLEAMACGCVNVMADLPVYREIVEDDDSAVLTPISSESVADTLIGLLADEKRRRRIADRGRSVVLEKAERTAQLAKVDELLKWGAVNARPRRRWRKAALLANLGVGMAEVCLRPGRFKTRSGAVEQRR